MAAASARSAMSASSASAAARASPADRAASSSRALRTIAEAIGRRCRELGASRLAEVLKDFAQIVLMAMFIRPRLYWLPAALPFLRLGQTIFPKDVPLKRLSGMKAGVLREWRTRLSESSRIRSEAAAYFSQRLSIGLTNGPSHPYLRLPILAATPAERDRIYSLSQRQGLGLSVAYPDSDQRDSRNERRLQRQALSLRPARCRTPLDHPDPPLALGERQASHCRMCRDERARVSRIGGVAQGLLTASP